MVVEQRQIETDYVDALSMVGVGDKIEKYRKRWWSKRKGDRVSRFVMATTWR